jgi:hypothetical protein
MNFAEQNAENRNSLSQPRFMTRVRNIISRNRRCSFCNETGHNILTCNDNRLTNFKHLCILQKGIFYLTNNARFYFKQWLMNYYIQNSEIVKAFAISKCNCRLNTLPEFIIEQITNYIFEDREEPLPDYIPLIEGHNIAAQALILLSLEGYANNRRSKFIINTNIQPLDVVKSEEICECSICYGDELREKNFISLNCNHKFCKDCFKGSLEHTLLSQIPTCALCRTEISSIKVHDESVKNDLDELITYNV